MAYVHCRMQISAKKKNIFDLKAAFLWGDPDQDLSGSWCIKGIGESALVIDSPVRYTMIQTNLGSLIRNRITPKEHRQKSRANNKRCNES